MDNKDINLFYSYNNIKEVYMDKTKDLKSLSKFFKFIFYEIMMYWYYKKKWTCNVKKYNCSH